VAIQVFEILARNRITPAGVVPLGTEPQRVQNLGVQMVLLYLCDYRFHEQILVQHLLRLLGCHLVGFGGSRGQVGMSR
jgi:hypothetical protein